MNTLHAIQKQLVHYGLIAVRIIVPVVTVLVLSLNQNVSALSEAQKRAFAEGAGYTNTEDSALSCAAGSDDGTIASVEVSSDSIKTTYDFLVANGYKPVAAAGITGNLMLESGGGPNEVKAASEELGGGGGYGIAQWTGGRRTAMFKFVQAEGKDPHSLAGQLDYLQHELKTGYTAAVTAVQSATTPDDAAEKFMMTFEHPRLSTANLPKRQEYARSVFKTYGGSAVTSTTENNSSACGTSTSSPDCATASGNAKILCEAEKYDPVSYQEVPAAGHQGGEAWHKTCPTIGPSCILDCSGLVTVATYDAYGNKGSWNTSLLVADPQNWQQINFSQLQSGDLIKPTAGHVEIVDHVTGSTIYTFGAHYHHADQTKDVGPDQFPAKSSNVYLRYVGEGAPA